MKKKQLTEIVLHLVFWIITTYAFINNSFLRSPSFSLFEEVLSVIFVIGVVYFNYTFLIFKYFNHNKLFKYFFFIILSLIIISFTEFLLIKDDVIKAINIDNDYLKNYALGWNFFGIFFRDALFVGFFTMFKIYRDAIKSYKLLQEKTDIEREQYITRIEMVKSKINTHFFFNSLNSIYSFALDKSDETTDLIMKLSRLMEYVVADSDNEWVKIDKEIEFIKNYIALENVRHPYMNVSFDLSGDTSLHKVPPMIFESFVNNAFKYTNLNEEGYIEIKLECKPGEILFCCKNSISRNSQKRITSTGKGLNNTRNRLNLHYKNKHQLNISEMNDIYNVELILKIY